MKKDNTFQKTIRFDEFILALKYFMRNKNVAHVSGLCNAEILRKDMSEEELSAIFFRALKHHVFVKQGTDVHINFELFRFLNAYTSSQTVVSIHKPSYGDNKMLSFARVEGIWMAMVQDAKKNEVSLIADVSLDGLYQMVEMELKKKDKNRLFLPQKVNAQLEGMNSKVRFLKDYEYQLVILAMENATGRQTHDSILFHVGKESFNMLTGVIEENQMESYSSEELDEKVKDSLYAMLQDGQGSKEQDESGEKSAINEGTKKINIEDDESYTQFSYEKLNANPNFPHSVPQLLKLQAIGWIKQFTNWKKWFFIFVIQLVFAFVVLFWNMYGLCYLNDTFRINFISFLGSATAYLFAGSVGPWNNIKGLSMFTKGFNTVLLVAPLYTLIGIAFRNILATILKKNIKHVFWNLLHFPANVVQYNRRSERSIVQCIWVGILITAPIGFVLWNPFTVGLLALILLLSCAKADYSNVSVPIMVFRSASSYQKVLEGRKKKPLFADIQLSLFGISVGFGAYTLMNLLVWNLFDYNFWVRLLFTALLMILALFGLGIFKINKPQKVVACLLLLIVCCVLMVLCKNGIIVYADDGGWTESGSNIWGLINNAGFGTILGLSALLALCTFGGSLLVAGIVGGIVAGGAFLWSTITDTGWKTSVNFMLGEYSPYKEEESLISTGLNIAVGLVPGIGEIWGINTGLRDASYHFSEGNVFSGVFNVVCSGLSFKDLDEGLNLAKEGLFNATTKTVLSKTLKNEIISSGDHVVQGVVANADDVGRGTRTIAGNAVTQSPKPGVVEDFVAGQISKKFVNTLMSGETTRIKKEMIERIASGVKSSVYQGLEGELSGKLDEAIKANYVETPAIEPVTSTKTVSSNNKVIISNGVATGNSASGSEHIGIDNSTTVDYSVNNPVEENVGVDVSMELQDKEISMEPQKSEIPVDLQETEIPLSEEVTEVFTSEELLEILNLMPDDVLKNVLDVIAEQFEAGNQALPSLCAELKQYIDSVGTGPIDRNVVAYIIQKG